MKPADVKMDYFDWMVDITNPSHYSGPHSFRKLLDYLHSVDFRYRKINDGDRMRDGARLRCRYAGSTDKFPYDYIIRVLDRDENRCSVFEMMLALAIRCEEEIMSDPRMGDRTAQWFWQMAVTMGLGGMTDVNFDEEKVSAVVDRFLERKYEPDGTGGLFKLRRSTKDVRKMSIWAQMCHYLDTMI